jgi:hypothetical protein
MAETPEKTDLEKEIERKEAFLDAIKAGKEEARKQPIRISRGAMRPKRQRKTKLIKGFKGR